MSGSEGRKFFNGASDGNGLTDFSTDNSSNNNGLDLRSDAEDDVHDNSVDDFGFNSVADE